MPAERLSMRKVREVLRLKHALGLSYRKISEATGVGKTQAVEYVRRAEAAGLAWPLPDGLDDAELDRRLFPIISDARGRPAIDWPKMQTELARRGVKFVRHWIGDERIVRLPQKWLKAGVLEHGLRHETVEGTPQGAVISPLLANIYLHYVYDLWVEQWRRRANGDVIVVRYADDTIVGFQHQGDAERFLIELKARLAQFALSLHPEKTRLIEFGKFAADRRSRRGLGKPETFDFLGFTHICETKADGSGFQIWRKTIRKRLKAKVREVKEELRRHVHASIGVQGRWLGSVMRGYFAYHAVPTNLMAIAPFRHHVIVRWLRVLRRRSQRYRMTWARMQRMVDRYLPKARVLHPWPDERFRVTHSR